MTIFDLVEAMIGEVEQEANPHRILIMYNQMFGQNLTPEDIEGFDKCLEGIVE